ncbi:hypothetical protein GCM10009613_30840 [Pseudonocardia kongjuensis]|uniref:Potassium channel domain-containing protein n=1 Tax=Pseudonocardia kongjuensis TaxID=102227 RepID=A0ABN1XU68_9PSEU
MASVTVLLAVYYAAPFDRPLNLRTEALFLGALALYAWLVARQVRAVIGAEYPRLRAARAVATGFPLFLVIYAGAYCIVTHALPESFSEPLTRTDALYFTVTVFATVGFGDITPVTELARVLVMTQMLLGLFVIGLVVRLLLGAVDRAEQDREARSADPGRDGGPSGRGPHR